MKGQGMAYRDVEELLPNQEGAVDTPADPPRLPPPRNRRRHAGRPVWASSTISEVGRQAYHHGWDGNSSNSWGRRQL